MAQAKGAQDPPSVTAGTFVTEAVVLRLTDHGEADRIATLLTESHGKVVAVAPGARRSRRRFGAALSPFGSGQAALRERRGQDLLLLESLHSERGFPHLSQELSRFSHAAYACELCLYLCPPGVPEPGVLTLLRAYLGYLDGLPLTDRPRVEPLRSFELRLLQEVGLGLSLQRCCACGRGVAAVSEEEELRALAEEEEDLAGGAGRVDEDDLQGGPSRPFDLQRGGVLCDGCSRSAAGGALLSRPLSPMVLRALQRLARVWPGTTTEALPPPLSAGVARGCREILLAVLQHHLGRDLRAVSFIQKLNLTSLGE